MGQGEVLEYLKKKTDINKPLSRKEIAEGIGITPNTCSFILRKLLKYNEVGMIELERSIAQKKYGCYHRVMLFYYKI